MNILFVVLRPLEINSSTSIWNNAIITGLIQNGHDVDVLTPQADENHSNYDQSLIDIKSNLIRIHKAPMQKAANFTRKNSILNKVRIWAYHIYKEIQIYDIGKSYIKKSIELTKSYDCIISSSDPKSSHLFAENYIKQNSLKIPWIQLWSDPFYGDITYKYSFLKEKIKREEKRLLVNATLVIYISELLKENRQRLYPAMKNKMYNLPIPYLSMDTDQVYEKNKNLVFAYCGDYFSNVRDILPLYNAINNSHHKLIICGSTDIELDTTQNVTIYPRVSYEKVKEIEKKADILVHLSNKSGVQIPGKIYQYSGTTKKILFILDGESVKIKKEFEKFNRYVFADNNEKTIEKIINTPSIWEECNNRVIQEFSPCNVTKEMLSILQDKIMEL